MTRRVAVTGLALVNPFGGDTADFFERMMRGESAVRLFQQQANETSIVQPSVKCLAFNSEQEIGRVLTNSIDRFSQLGVAAALSAWKDAGFQREGDGSNDYGVSWGTGCGGALTFEKGYSDFYERGKTRLSPMSVPMAMHNAAASHIAITLGLGSACLSYSVACASSSVSIGEAFRRIKWGESSVVVAGGSEACLSFSVMRAWDSMRVIASGTEETAYRACRPFQSGRAGFVLGEGAAALVLEDWEHAVARGARIYCELAGFGQSCDHLHLVRPDANGQVRAMQAAIREAGLQPSDISYVNAHGTATPEGDPIEINALKMLFGEHAEQVHVSSTKSMHGHLLGAAGAVEALITALAVSKQQIPPTAYLEQVSEDCQGVKHVMGVGLRDVVCNAAMSSSFAFGGSNAVLVFKAAS